MTLTDRLACDLAALIDAPAHNRARAELRARITLGDYHTARAGIDARLVCGGGIAVALLVAIIVAVVLTKPLLCGGA
jgi:hypothetical protein